VTACYNAHASFLAASDAAAACADAATAAAGAGAGFGAGAFIARGESAAAAAARDALHGAARSAAAILARGAPTASASASTFAASSSSPLAPARVCLRLKRLLLSVAECIDWSRLRFPAMWPPHARAEWSARLLRGAGARDILSAVALLEAALRADDAAAAEALALAAGASAAAHPGAAAQSCAAARAPPGQWLPDWYIDASPSVAASALPSVCTLAAAAARIGALASALGLQAHSQASNDDGAVMGGGAFLPLVAL